MAGEIPTVEDVLAAVKHVGINSKAPDMLSLYAPLLSDLSRSSVDAYKVVRDQRYGEGERNLLDVYMPPKENERNGRVVIWMHGGGFTVGENNGFQESMRTSGKTYFSRNGYICVIPSFGLVPNIQYPKGGGEFGAIVKWTKDNVATWGGDPELVFGVGHTTGATFIAEWIYGEASKGPFTKLPLAGVVYLSALFTPVASPPFRLTAVNSYYGNETAEGQSPLDLFSGLSKGHPFLALPTLICLPEFESEEFVKAAFAFVEAWRGKNGGLPLLKTVPGHNHISQMLALGTGDNGAGKDILEFIGC